jgi:hypothetical protein
MKEDMLKRFAGQYCSVERLTEQYPDIPRSTVIWNINGLVKQGKASRVGRGLYSFVAKPQFQSSVSAGTETACDLLSEKFRYLPVTVTDTTALSEFMNLLPFSTVVSLETKKSAADSVLSALRKGGIEAYAKRDFIRMERYVSSSQPIVVRSELTVNPSLPQKNNLRRANLEKILVDLVCDEDIYSQYQGEELRNIYVGATERYAVNYSQLLKYAAARKKKPEVVELLQDTTEFQKVRDLL